jgi:hypothetical protein
MRVHHLSYLLHKTSHHHNQRTHNHHIPMALDEQQHYQQMTITIHQEKLEYTVEKVAINAVMAGARPEYMPVMLTALDLLMEPREESTL